MKGHQVENGVRCITCGEIFSEESDLIAHSIKEHPENGNKDLVDETGDHFSSVREDSISVVTDPLPLSSNQPIEPLSMNIELSETDSSTGELSTIDVNAIGLSSSNSQFQISENSPSSPSVKQAQEITTNISDTIPSEDYSCSLNNPKSQNHKRGNLLQGENKTSSNFKRISSNSPNTIENFISYDIPSNVDEDSDNDVIIEVVQVSPPSEKIPILNIAQNSSGSREGSTPQNDLGAATASYGQPQNMSPEEHTSTNLSKSFKHCQKKLKRKTTKSRSNSKKNVPPDLIPLALRNDIFERPSVDDNKDARSIHTSTLIGQVPQVTGVDWHSEMVRASINKQTTVHDPRQSCVPILFDNVTDHLENCSKSDTGLPFPLCSDNRVIQSERQLQNSTSKTDGANDSSVNQSGTQNLPFTLEQLRSRMKKSVLSMVPLEVQRDEDFKKKAESAVFFLIGKETVQQLGFPRKSIEQVNKINVLMVDIYCIEYSLF